MSTASLVAIVCVAVWVALVVTVQILTPEQSWLSMGMSGLATGPYGWMMKLALAVRGVGAGALVAALYAVAPDPSSLAYTLGLFLIASWGVGSALLAAFDTDMPGDEPSAHGKTHALIAGLAYLDVMGGMILVSFTLPDSATARWAVGITFLAVLALGVQQAGFKALARDVKAARAADGRPAAGPFGAPELPVPFAFARYVGLAQRVFVGLVMVWTVVVAAGVG